MTCVVNVKKLVKTYGNVQAVRDLSFHLNHGQTLGLLGGNGAGKTTTLSMMLGLVIPTSGQIDIFGYDMLTNRFPALARMNFSSPYVSMPGRLTVQQNLRVYARFYDVAHPYDRADELIDELDLSKQRHQQTGDLSAGQQTRVSVAKSLINKPGLLILDEPTASLDPDSADWMRTYLKDYQRQTGAALVLASHNMNEVERLCDDVLMMKDGRIEDQGTPKTLIARYGHQNMEEVFLAIARKGSV